MLVAFFLFFLMVGLFVYKSFQSFHIAKNEVEIEYNITKAGLVEFLPSLPYFLLLNNAEKKEFIDRVFYFKRNLTFHSKDDIVLTPEMKTLFAALCAKITFGFFDYKLETLQHVFFFQDSFYATSLDQEVTGLTTDNGMVFLSWKETKEGVDNPYSKFNLGLHELAHILEIEAKKIYTSWNMEKWYSVALANMKNMKKSDSNPLFRAYGLTNEHECWAVSVEYFFEQPHEFKANFPALFSATQKVLNQTIPLRMKA